MKEDLLGSMKAGLLKQRGRLKEALVKQLKLQVPKGGIPAHRQIEALDNLGLMDMMKLRQEYGDDALNNLIFNIEKLRADGRRTQ
jgi:hypothetical protein